MVTSTVHAVYSLCGNARSSIPRSLSLLQPRRSWGSRSVSHPSPSAPLPLSSLSSSSLDEKPAGCALGRRAWTRGKWCCAKWRCWWGWCLHKGLTRTVTLDRALDGGDWGYRTRGWKESIGGATIEQGANPQSCLFHIPQHDIIPSLDSLNAAILPAPRHRKIRVPHEPVKAQQSPSATFKTMPVDHGSGARRPYEESDLK